MFEETRRLQSLVVIALASTALLFSDNAQGVTVDYRTLGTFATPSLSQGDITVTGSGDVNVLNLNGLGIVGGFTNNTLDGGTYPDTKGG